MFELKVISYGIKFQLGLIVVFRRVGPGGVSRLDKKLNWTIVCKNIFAGRIFSRPYTAQRRADLRTFSFNEFCKFSINS